MKAHQLINQDSGDTEYYTPMFIIEAARRVMGGVIDLDPFSSFEANRQVVATSYYTIWDDGLVQPWYGNVWMNHPFSRTMNKSCVEKLVTHYLQGKVRQALCITFAATSEQWFQPLFQFPQCFLCPRTNYHLPDGTLKKGVTKGSVVTYLGWNKDGFIREFKSFGAIK